MEGEAAVGRRVRVFWEGEGEWFDGVVVTFSSESGYFVRYDDGEEQWESAGDAIVFTPSPSDEDAVADEEDVGEPAMPSPSYPQQEFEDDGGGDAVSVELNDCEGQQPGHSSPYATDSPSPIPSSRSASDLDRKPQQRPAVATTRALKGGGAAFFRDEDALRESKRVLEAEKRELLRSKATLETQLASKESESAGVKRELQQLKTQVSLASALHYSSSSSNSSSSLPATAIEWKQRALDLRLGNQQLTEDIVELKTAWQTQQKRVNDQQQRVDQLRAKIGRVPQRELLTLTELQVAIAQLLQRKRELEAALRTASRPTARNSRQPRAADSVDGQEAKRTALEKQLARLELSLTQSQEDARGWRTRLECERARLQPMHERLSSLRAELSAQAGSKRGDGRGVLLHSLFLRADNDGDGVVDRVAAVEAIELVLGREGAGGETIQATGELTFDQFVDEYHRLAARSMK